MTSYQAYRIKKLIKIKIILKKCSSYNRDSSPECPGSRFMTRAAALPQQQITHKLFKIIFHLLRIFWKAKNKDCWWIFFFYSLTSFSKLFSTYSTYFGKQKIKIADGSFSSIVGQGTIKINPTLSLKSMLHVPSLFYNLLSMGKITKDFNCSVIFTSSGCTFQDSIMGSTIGHAEEKDRLYYPDTNWKMGVLRS